VLLEADDGFLKMEPYSPYFEATLAGYKTSHCLITV
jgi:hypothetical protein